MLYKLSKSIYLDTCSEQYKNIITINPKPTGPTLQPYIKQINLNNLYDRTNHFRNINQTQKCNYCDYVFVNVPGIEYCNGDKNNIVSINELPELLIFLDGLGYTFDKNMTKALFINKNISNRDFIGFIKN